MMNFLAEQDLCVLPAVVGECYNYTERWYYDSQASRCKPFYYGGCGGNNNNFESQAACQRRCESHRPPPQVDRPAPVQPEQEPFRIGKCYEFFFYYAAKMILFCYKFSFAALCCSNLKMAVEKGKSGLQ